MISLHDLIVGLFRGELARIRYPEIAGKLTYRTSEIVGLLDPFVTVGGRLVPGWLDGQDVAYSTVRRDWLKDAAEDFKAYREQLRVREYSDKNDCDDMAFDFLRYCRNAYAQTDQEAQAPLVAFVKRPGHALCLVATDEGFVFFDPEIGIVSKPQSIYWIQF